MFVDEAYRQSADYKEFWTKLNRGEYQAAEYKRIGKGGKEVWIQASYNPIFDSKRQAVQGGEVCNGCHREKTEATPTTRARLQPSAIASHDRVQDDGTIVTANENFLKTLGYTLDEIKGRHHSMFVEEAYRQSSEYKEFWAKSEQRRIPSGRVQADRQGRQGSLDPGFL